MNCKIGDLAYVVFAIHKECIGRIVQVIAPGQFLNSWRIEFEGVEPATLPPGGERNAMDSWLRPISGVPVEDEKYEEVPA